MAKDAKYVDLGSSEVKRVTQKAALLDIVEIGEKWVPLSQLSPETASDCVEGNTLGSTHVAGWLVDKWSEED